MKYTAGRTNSAFIQRVGVNKKTYIRAIPNDRGCIFFFPRRFYHVKNNISNKKVSKRLEMIFFLWNFSFSTVQFFPRVYIFRMSHRIIQRKKMINIFFRSGLVSSCFSMFATRENVLSEVQIRFTQNNTDKKNVKNLIVNVFFFLFFLPILSILAYSADSSLNIFALPKYLCRFIFVLVGRWVSSGCQQIEIGKDATTSKINIIKIEIDRNKI